MKRILLVCFVACWSVLPVRAQNTCVFNDYEQQQLSLHRDLQLRHQAIEANLQLAKSQREAAIAGVDGNGTIDASIPVIRIPVVVHVVYKNSTQNISDAQIASQIEVLNQDYRRANSDTSSTPAGYKPLAADCYIEFELAKVDPNGYATSGIVRTKSTNYSFGSDDKVKSTADGGDDAWDADKYLNIWVCDLSMGLYGYSSILGCDKSVDGVVISYTAFGTSGTAESPHDKGRIATHEIGHWLGLKHIWGDAYCGDDGIDDTPQQKTSTRGCPGGIVVTCTNGPYGDMYMNYMDLTNDACMNMFTAGQRDRMRSLFGESGPRYALLSSTALTATPIPAPEESPLPDGDKEAVVTTSVNLFPNPASTQVTVDITTNSTALMGQKIQVHNHLGQLVLSTRITSDKTTLNISALGAGIYFVRVGNERQVYKLLKGTGLAAQ